MTDSCPKNFNLQSKYKKNVTNVCNNVSKIIHSQKQKKQSKSHRKRVLFLVQTDTSKNHDKKDRHESQKRGEIYLQALQKIK